MSRSFLTTLLATIVLAGYSLPAWSDDVLTRITVEIPLGPGYHLYLGGAGAGLSWDKNHFLPGRQDPPGSSHWVFEFQTPKRGVPFVYKPVIRKDADPDLAIYLENPNQPAVTGQTTTLREPKFEFKTGRIQDLVVEGIRRVRIFTPADYDPAKEKPLPSLWILDGQAAFSPGPGTPSQTLHADSIADRMMGSGLMPRMYIVAVDNTGAGRRDEYSFTATSDGNGGGPEFVAKTLPAIMATVERDSHFHFAEGPENHAILGTSLSGEAAMLAATTGRFADIVSLSGSHWWDDSALAKVIGEKLKALRFRPRIFLHMGTQESTNPKWSQEALDGADTMRKKLVEAGYQEGQDLFYVVVPDGRHSEDDWSAFLPIPFSGIFTPEEECSRLLKKHR